MPSMLAHLPTDVSSWVELRFFGGIVNVVVAALIFWSSVMWWRTAPRRSISRFGTLTLAALLYLASLFSLVGFEELRRRAGVELPGGCAAGQAIGLTFMFHAAAWVGTFLVGTIACDLAVSRIRAGRRLSGGPGSSAA